MKGAGDNPMLESIISGFAWRAERALWANLIRQPCGLPLSQTSSDRLAAATFPIGEGCGESSEPEAR